MSNYVLIVDDEPAIRNLLANLLTGHGIACVACENGRAALKQLEEGRVPALILLDLKMPGMDGWQFGERLQSDPRLRDIPVATISGDPRGRQNFRQVAHLNKPFDVGILLTVVTEYCDS